MYKFIFILDHFFVNIVSVHSFKKVCGFYKKILRSSNSLFGSIQSLFRANTKPLGQKQSKASRANTKLTGQKQSKASRADTKLPGQIIQSF